MRYRKGVDLDRREGGTGRENHNWDILLRNWSIFNKEKYIMYLIIKVKGANEIAQQLRTRFALT